jgi:tRNA dimethylallyltransferase
VRAAPAGRDPRVACAARSCGRRQQAAIRAPPASRDRAGGAGTPRSARHPRPAILRAVPPLPLVALFGPTGVGKTEVAIALAELLRAEGEDPVAVSADALQLYAGLEILTGAAAPEDRARLEHRLLGILPLTARATAGDFARRAHAEIDGLIAAGRRPIVVGGTGLYLRAALADLDLRPPADPQFRARYAARLAGEGAQALHAELAERDPAAAATLAPTDSQRVVRALELLDAGVEPPGGSQLWTADTRHPTLLVALVMEREELYRRIDARVLAMVEAGAVEEVRRADAAGASSSARQALGFEELLRGDVEGMQRRTRRYAKRQLTWLRKLPGALRIDVTGRDAHSVAGEVHSALRAAAASSSEPTKRENGATNAQ